MSCFHVWSLLVLHALSGNTTCDMQDETSTRDGLAYELMISDITISYLDILDLRYDT